MAAAPDASAPAAQAGPIAVYGATGFTGRLVARELRRRGADLVLAGRDGPKLEALSRELGGVPIRAAALDDPEGLRNLLEPCSTVAACAGPFSLHGEPLLAAALATSTHYLDTTGEQTYMRMVFERYGEEAAKRGVALIPAMGFDYAPGDMLAARVAAGMGPLEEIVIAYWVRGFAPTRGTALSALEVLRGGDVIWSEGGWRPAPRSSDGGQWRFPDPIGTQPMLRYPAGEQITVPRHVQTRSVRTLLSGMVVPARMTRLAAHSGTIAAIALRTPLRHAAAALVRRLPAGPDERRRGASCFTLSCEARAGSRTRAGTASGRDVYALTAQLVARGALLCAAPSFAASGALAPAQAFEPAAFLESLADVGVSSSVEPLPADPSTPRPTA